MSSVNSQDLWLAKDNRFLNPKISFERILMAPPCRLINKHYLEFFWRFLGNQSWFSVCGGSELSSRNRTSYKDRHAIPKEMISCSRRYSSLLSEESIRLLIFYDSNFHFYSLSNGGQEQQAVERKTASSFGNKFLYLTAVSTALSRRRSSVSCSLPRLTVQSSRPWLLSQLSPLLHCWISFSYACSFS